MSDWKAGDTAWVWDVCTGTPEKLSFRVLRKGQAGVAVDADGVPRFVAMDSLHRTADACWQAHIDKLRQAELAAIGTRQAASNAYFEWRAKQGKDTANDRAT